MPTAAKALCPAHIFVEVGEQGLCLIEQGDGALAADVRRRQGLHLAG
jgi:hypothetical protein